RKLTVRENLTHQGHLYGLRGKVLSQRMNELLVRFQLQERQRDRTQILSGGMARRVEIAKGLLHAPSILLLDEPSTGLDPAARRELWLLLQELRQREEVTVFLTTHIMEEAEGCDRVAILHQGSLISLGRPEDLKSEVQGDVLSLQSEDPSGLSARIA